MKLYILIPAKVIRLYGGQYFLQFHSGQPFKSLHTLKFQALDVRQIISLGLSTFIWR